MLLYRVSLLVTFILLIGETCCEQLLQGLFKGGGAAVTASDMKTLE